MMQVWEGGSLGNIFVMNGTLNFNCQLGAHIEKVTTTLMIFCFPVKNMVKEIY